MNPRARILNCDMPEKFEDLKAEALGTMVKVNTMHDRLGEIHTHTQNLDCLPELVKEVRATRESLIGPATGKRRVDIATHLITVGVLAIALIILVADRFNTSVKITEKGFTIERGIDAPK